MELTTALAVTTYSAGALLFLRSGETGVQVGVHKMARPMGVACDGKRLAVGSRSAVHVYINQEKAAAKFQADACYLPRTTHYTGYVDCHDVAMRPSGGVYIVATQLSAVCTLNPNFSVVPFWQPNVVSKIAPDDRCHLNGMAVRHGQLTHVTALGFSDRASGWRRNKLAGGVLYDVQANRVVAGNLCMPHSPRWHRNELYFLESGQGRLKVISDNQIKTVCQLPGFARGLSFHGRFAYVGLSEDRDGSAGAKPPVAAGAVSGIAKINLNTRAFQVYDFRKHNINVGEVFEIACLPHDSPVIAGPESDALTRGLVLPGDSLIERVA